MYPANQSPIKLCLNDRTPCKHTHTHTFAKLPSNIHKCLLNQPEYIIFIRSGRLSISNTEWIMNKLNDPIFIIVIVFSLMHITRIRIYTAGIAGTFCVNPWTFFTFWLVSCCNHKECSRPSIQSPPQPNTCCEALLEYSMRCEWRGMTDIWGRNNAEGEI